MTSGGVARDVLGVQFRHETVVHGQIEVHVLGPVARRATHVPQLVGGTQLLSRDADQHRNGVMRRLVLAGHTARQTMFAPQLVPPTPRQSRLLRASHRARVF
jgi:hypothetical protein